MFKIFIKSSILAVMTLSLVSCSIGKKQPAEGTIIDGSGAKPSFHTSQEHRNKLQKDFTEYDIPIKTTYSNLYWSQDNKYILFQGDGDQDGASQNEGHNNHIILADFEKGTMYDIRKGFLMGRPDWSPDGTKAAFLSEGIYVLDLKTRNLTLVSEKGYKPVFSPDGTKLAYSDDGICIYSMSTGETRRVTNRPDDIAAAWFSDNYRMLFFRNNGKKLTDGAGYEQNLSILDTRREDSYFDVLPDNKGKFRGVEWVVQDKVFHLEAGWDDGFYDYIVNLQKHTDVFIGERTAGHTMASVDVYKDRVIVGEGAQIKLYDLEMKKIDEYTIKEDTDNRKTKYNLYHQFLPDGRIAVWHAEQTLERGSLIVIDIEKRLQQLVVDYAAANCFYPSNDGKVAALVEYGKRIRFYDIPPAIDLQDLQTESEIRKLYPANEGYEWIYNGLAEYGHTMKLDKITETENGLQYRIKGTFQSASGFPPTEEDRFTIDYILTDSSIREVVVKPGRLPHKITEFDLIRAPLKKGTKWSEEVLIEGKKALLSSEIIDEGTDERSSKYYTIRFKAPLEGFPNNTYVETRTLKEGIGIKYFENTFNKEILFNYGVFEPGID